MQIEFQGAARTVTGSMHLLHGNGFNVLLDCGLFQGHRQEANERNGKFPFDPRSIDAVALSHAHIDHSGNLPGLVKQGYRGPIYCITATLDLSRVMLADSGHIQEKDAEFLNTKIGKHHGSPIEPLYTPKDAAAAMEHFRGVPYENEFDVYRGVSAKFSDAGHILGSASVKIAVRENGLRKTLGFTGDLGRWNMPIIRDPAFLGNADVLISESTYGGKLHDPPETMEQQLAEVLRRTSARGGKVIVPAFSVGRTQDLVYALQKLRDKGQLPDMPVYVDSPLAIDATDIFRQHPECFDDEMRQHIGQNRDPLGSSRLHYVRSAEESKKLNRMKDPCMIIAASGMCEAGRILHHLANNIEDPRTTILIVGYQAENTLGKKLVDRWEGVKIFGEVYRRKAEVVVLNSFSAHADGNELLRYIGQFDKRQLGQIFLVHGEVERAQKLRTGLNDRGYSHVDIPVRGQKFDM